MLRLDAFSRPASAAGLTRPKPPRDTGSATLLGLSGIGLAMLVLGLWAFMAPLSSAVVATGKFVAQGKNKNRPAL